MRSIFLLSDGEANLGVTNQQTLQQTTAHLLDSSGNIKLYTFGFGHDYDAELLQGLAQSGSGTSFHITDPNSIPTSMASALGGLLTLAAQNVQLTVRSQVGLVGNACSAVLLCLWLCLDQPHRQSCMDPGCRRE